MAGSTLRSHTSSSTGCKTGRLRHGCRRAGGARGDGRAGPPASLGDPARRLRVGVPGDGGSHRERGGSTLPCVILHIANGFRVSASKKCFSPSHGGSQHIGARAARRLCTEKRSLGVGTAEGAGGDDQVQVPLSLILLGVWQENEPFHSPGPSSVTWGGRQPLLLGLGGLREKTCVFLSSASAPK